MLRLTVDGVTHSFAGPEGETGTLLTSLRQLGADVPALCYDERCRPQGACRLCMVEVDGRTSPVPACTTPVRDGMAVVTRSPALDQLRRSLLGLLARDYPAEAMADDLDQPFHQLLRTYDVTAGRPIAGTGTDDSHPLIAVDMDLCISCFRCVRICEEVQGQFVWQIAGRGAATKVVADSPTGLLADSACVSCGACVDTCPTSALADKPQSDTAGLTGAVRWTRTTCPYCGVGCEMEVASRDGTVVGVRPAHDAPVNRGHLCVKGRYGYRFNASPDRLTTPLVRVDGRLQPVSWPDAIRTIAERLGDLIATRGPQAVGVLGSARATNEENYVAQKFARAVLGTNNVDCCARVCHAPSAAALREVLGTGAATSSYDDIERAATIVVCGSNATENHPIVGARIKQAARRGAHLVVIDPRRTELAGLAEIHLRPRPGTNVTVLNALASVLVQEGLVDEGFLHRRTEGIEDYAHWVKAYDPAVVAAACGLDPVVVAEAARLLATETPTVFFHGLGLTEHAQGTEAVMCLINLALLTGNVGRPGTGVNPLRGQNNVQGAAHMGCEPHNLTGFAPVDEARDRFGSVWGVTPPDQAGLDAMEMLDAAARGELHALWVVGWHLLLSQPDTTTTRRALEQVDFLVVQDIFLNETARELADVVLPAASAFEKDGTFMNAERRVQRVRRVVEPPGQAKPDWEPFQLVAREMGRGELLPYHDAEEIWDEVRLVWEPGLGMTYARLDEPGSLQWPCPTVEHPGTTLLHTTSFPKIGPKARLCCIDDAGTAERTDAEHPFVLVTGRGLYQFNAGTMTNRTPLRQIRPTDTLEIAPADAAELGVAAGQPIRVISRFGEATLPAEVTDRVAPGTVFATFSDPRVALNHLIGPQVDPITHTPEYKVTAVHLSRA